MTRIVPQSSLTSDSAGRCSVPMKIRSRQPSLRSSFCGAAELPDRDPVMAEALDPNRIAGAFEREQDRRDAALAERVRHRERHGAAAGDDADRRSNPGSR